MGKKGATHHKVPVWKTSQNPMPHTPRGLSPQRPPSRGRSNVLP